VCASVNWRTVGARALVQAGLATNQTETAMNATTIDAITLLHNDHRELDALFARYGALGEHAALRKQTIADDICTALTLHSMVEQEIFYPAVREAGGAARVEQALRAHAHADALVARLRDMEPDDALYDATVLELGAQVARHVAEEEDALLPLARQAGLDLVALADAMLSRKEALSTML
jgi:hypothetical protein